MKCLLSLDNELSNITQRSFVDKMAGGRVRLRRSVGRGAEVNDPGYEVVYILRFKYIGQINTIRAEYFVVFLPVRYSDLAAFFFFLISLIRVLHGQKRSICSRLTKQG